MTTDRCLLAGLLLIAAPLAAQQRQRETPPPGGQPRDFRLAEPRTFALDNGLAVTLVQYGDVPKTTVQLAVRSGNLNESASEVWLSDLTGDMMQEGTTTRSAAQVAEAAAGMGGQLSVNVGLDESSVAGDVLSEFAPDFVRLVADVARNPALPAAELPRLKANRVRNLSVQLRSPQSQTVARFRAAMYPDHPYGRVFPTADQINGYTAEQVRAFHAANWGAGRARLTIVGNFDDRAMETAIREAFGSWARGSDAVVNVPTPVARRDLLTVDRPTAPQSTLAIAIPVEDPSHADWIALLVTNTLLGGGFSSRITTNIREDKGYTYSPFSAVSARYRDAYWVQNADVTTAQTGASLHEIFKEIDRLRAEAPTAAELEAVQNLMAGTFVLQNSSRGGIAGQLGFVRLHGLDRSYLTNYVRNVYGVTPADVHRIAKQYLDPARMLITVTGDLNVIRDQLTPYQTMAP
jgi:predicted Zn-dependent peptidase